MGTIDYKKIADERRAGWRDATSGENRSFEKLLTGLYSENNHFIYELLQNAEDAEASFLTFICQEERLLVLHDGRPFNEADVWGICSVMEGTKQKEDAQKIGHFGVGFKSVFKYTDRPEIYSNEEAFAIENILLPVAIPRGDFPADCTYQLDGRTVFPFEGKENCTKFVLLFRDRAELSRSGIDPDDIPRKLQELEPEILLFLRHVRTLTWVDETTGAYGTYQNIPSKTETNTHTCEKRYISAGEEELEAQKYLVLEDRFDCDEMKNACVKVAFSIDRAIKPVKDAKVWVFFPTTDESGLSFLLHGTYQTPISREKIISDSSFNKMLHDKAEALIVRSMEDLRKRGLLTQGFLRQILFPSFQSPWLTGLKEKITDAFRNGQLLPAYSGKEYLTISQALLAIPYDLPELVGRELLSRTVGAGSSFVAFSDVGGSGGKEYYRWLRDDLQVASWTALDLACLLPEALENITGGIRGLFAFFKSVADETRATPRGSRTDPYYFDVWKICNIEMWKELGTKTIFPNRAGNLVPAWIEKKRNLYLQGKGGGPELSAEKLADTSRLTFDNPESSGKAVTEEEIRDLLGEYFNIAVYDHTQYVKENIYPKYSGDTIKVTTEEHIEDMRQILQIPVAEVDRNVSFLRAREGETGQICYKELNHSTLYFEYDTEGISLKEYFSGLPSRYYFVDLAYYEEKEISKEMLKQLKVRDSLISSSSEQHYGTCAGRREQQLGYDGRSSWNCGGKFWYKFSLVELEDALNYIEDHPSSDRAREKSKIIFHILRSNDEHLRGKLRFSSGRVIENQVCDAIWRLSQRKWLFTAVGEWVRASEVSQLDLDPELYERLPYESVLYQCLNFREDERDKVERYKQIIHKIPAEELIKLLCIIPEELQRQGHPPQANMQEHEWEFPWQPVQDEERLRNHVLGQYALSSRTRYEYIMRRIRVTGNDGRAYLSGLYKRDGTYACQLCHRPVPSFEAVELENTPQRELEQMNLCLCHDCAERYREIRRDADAIAELKQQIQDQNVKGADRPIPISLKSGDELLFSPIHLAEIQILLNLQKEELKLDN